MINFSNIDVKAFLETLEDSVKDFGYDTSYQNGSYECRSLNDGCEIAWGRKLKTKQVAFVVARDKGSNQTLKLIGSPYCIGDKLTQKELLQEEFRFSSFWEKEFEGYLFRVSLNQDLITSIEIDHKETILHNSGYLNAKKRADKFTEVEGASLIKDKLQGLWGYSPLESSKFCLKKKRELFYDEVPRVIEFMKSGFVDFYSLSNSIMTVNEREIASAISQIEESDLDLKQHDFLIQFKASQKSLVQVSIPNAGIFLYVKKSLGSYAVSDYYKISKIFKNGTFSVKEFSYDGVSNFKFSFEGDMLILDLPVYKEKTPRKIVYLRAEKSVLLK